ncbi:hypothetical protein ACLKA6_002039 [Drosophila palustris]
MNNNWPETTNNVLSNFLSSNRTYKQHNLLQQSSRKTLTRSHKTSRLMQNLSLEQRLEQLKSQLIQELDEAHLMEQQQRLYSVPPTTFDDPERDLPMRQPLQVDDPQQTALQLGSWQQSNPKSSPHQSAQQTTATINSSSLSQVVPAKRKNVESTQASKRARIYSPPRPERLQQQICPTGDQQQQLPLGKRRLITHTHQDCWAPKRQKLEPLQQHVRLRRIRHRQWSIWTPLQLDVWLVLATLGLRTDKCQPTAAGLAPQMEAAHLTHVSNMQHHSIQRRPWRRRFSSPRSRSRTRQVSHRKARPYNILIHC